MASTPRTESDIVDDLCRIKGERFVAYRKEWDKVNCFELETDFPLFLHIEPNYRCNFRCPMCTQGNPELIDKFGYPEQLRTADILKILDEAQRYHCPSISFQGDNEPFLIKELPDWFAQARTRGFLDIMVNTNGSVMTQKLAERVVSSGLTRIRFSLDAVTPDTYAKIRIGGNFTRVMKNIELFLEVRRTLGSPLPRVGVNCVRMAANADEIEEFKTYWSERVDFVVVQDFMTPDTEGDYHHLDVATRPSVDNFRCAQPWQRLYIRGNGDVTPCCAMFSSYLKLGNIHNTSLHELWNSAPARELRMLQATGRYAENPVCLKCSKNGRQGG